MWQYLRDNPGSQLSQAIEDATATAVGEDEERLVQMAKKDFRALRLRLINRNPGAWRDRASLFEDPNKDEGPPVAPPTPDNVGHEKVTLPAPFAKLVTEVLRESITRSQRGTEGKKADAGGGA